MFAPGPRSLSAAFKSLAAALFFLAGAGSYVLIVAVTALKHGPSEHNVWVLGTIYAPMVFGLIAFAIKYLYRFQVVLAQHSVACMQSDEPGAMYRPLIPVRYAAPGANALRLIVAVAVLAGIGIGKVADYDLLRQPWLYAVTPLYIFCEVYLNELNCGRTERRIRMRTGNWANWEVDNRDLSRAIIGGIVGVALQFPVLALLSVTPTADFIIPALLSFWCWGVILSYWAWLNIADWLLTRKMRLPAPQAR